MISLNLFIHFLANVEWKPHFDHLTKCLIGWACLIKMLIELIVKTVDCACIKQ